MFDFTAARPRPRAQHRQKTTRARPALDPKGIESQRRVSLFREYGDALGGLAPLSAAGTGILLIALIRSALDRVVDLLAIQTALGPQLRRQRHHGMLVFEQDAPGFRLACHSACNIDPLSRGIGVQN
jgi:hypothetical protein